MLSSQTLYSVLLTHYCSDDKIEKNEIGWACSTYGGGAFRGFWSENLSERAKLEDSVIDGRIILR